MSETKPRPRQFVFVEYRVMARRWSAGRDDAWSAVSGKLELEQANVVARELDAGLGQTWAYRVVPV